MTGPKNMFWDSCVFIRYLTENPPHRLTDIHDFIRDARKGERQIWYSTISLTEIRPRYLKQKGYQTAHEFLEDFTGAFYPVDPTPDIMIAAGRMRDVDPTHPANHPNAKPRCLGTPDSIQLASCLHVRDNLGIGDIVFHTFDNGKGATWEGKCVPLLTLHEWYPNSARHPFIADVCSLPRQEPIYPQLRLFASGD